jgi:hypothetical protein
LEDRYLFGEDDRKGQTKVKTNGVVRTNVVVRRIASDEATDPFLILATWGVTPDTATTLYRRRWEIETLFAALKSRGFKLEKTHLTTPMQKFLHRVERLVGLLALAFAWTHMVGEKRAFCQGQPPTKTHGRPERSLFRYALDWLQSILTTPEPQRKAFFACLQGLRSPTSFLSCTNTPCRFAPDLHEKAIGRRSSSYPANRFYDLCFRSRFSRLRWPLSSQNDDHSQLHDRGVEAPISPGAVPRADCHAGSGQFYEHGAL